MHRPIDLKTDLIEMDDKLIIRFLLPDGSNDPTVHVEHFGDLVRVRGQAGTELPQAFTKSVPITCGSEPPSASLQNGILSITIKRPTQTHSTYPKSIS